MKTKILFGHILYANDDNDNHVCFAGHNGTKMAAICTDR